MKAITNFINNQKGQFAKLAAIWKTAYRDKVDVFMSALIVILGIIDLYSTPLQGGILFFGAYAIFAVWRLAKWKLFANQYVTDPAYRELLKLPKLKDDGNN